MKNIKTLLTVALTLAVVSLSAQTKASDAVAEIKDGKLSTFEVGKASQSGLEASPYIVKYPSSWTIIEEKGMKAGIQNEELKIAIVTMSAAMAGGQVEQLVANPTMGGLIAGQMGAELLESVNVTLPSGEKAVKISMKVPKGEDYNIITMYIAIIGEDVLSITAVVEGEPTKIDGLYEEYVPVIESIFKSFAKK